MHYLPPTNNLRLFIAQMANVCGAHRPKLTRRLTNTRDEARALRDHCSRFVNRTKH